MACIYVILALQAVITIYPLIWMILSSLKDNVSFFVDPWSLPKEPRFYNYVTAWQEGIQGYMLNSVNDCYCNPDKLCVFFYGSSFPV